MSEQTGTYKTTKEQYAAITLESFALDNWTPAKDVRDYVATQLGTEELTARQWTAFRKEHDIEATNIKGIWHVRYAREDDETVETVDDASEMSNLPLVKPNVVTFGNFSSSLAVVNNVSTDSMQVHNTTFNTGALANEADTFVSQLGAFTEFLSNTEAMLSQREQDLKEQTRIKADALQATRLQVEVIKQRALQAQRNNIAVKVQNDSLDAQMTEVVELGKSLHTDLSGLQE